MTTPSRKNESHHSSIIILSPDFDSPPLRTTGRGKNADSQMQIVNSSYGSRRPGDEKGGQDTEGAVMYVSYGAVTSEKEDHIYCLLYEIQTLIKKQLI